MKPRIAIIRGAFLNRYEMQFFEQLVDRYDITAFGSQKPFHDTFTFPVVKLPSPMDIPEIPYKLPILNRLFTDAHYLWGLEDKLKGFDLVHTAETYFHYTQQALNARKKGYVKKVIATVLENIPFNNEGIRGRSEFKQRARTELDHMIALTEQTRQTMILEGADSRKITVISHFVDTKRFIPGERNNDKKLVLLFCGRLEKYKGIYEFLYAAKSLLLDADLSDYKISFRMVGDGSEKQRILALERKLGITPFVEHKLVSYAAMPKEYAAADIYIAPSLPTETYQEQYNTTLLEAQAAGLPIVTTYCGGIPENVGEAAILVQPADVLSLKNAMKLLITDRNLREEFGKKARKRAETVHDACIGANKIQAVWERVLHDS